MSQPVRSEPELVAVDRAARGSDRRTANIVGVLFLVALVPFLIGAALYGPSTGSSDFLDHAYPDRAVVILGVLFEFVAVLAIPLIGVFMFPVLKRYHEALALAYVALRSLEALLLVTAEAKVLSLIDLSDDHLNTASTDGSRLQAIGDAVLAEKDRAFVLYVLVFGVGALIFYGLLYQSRLVPRWLSGWGFAAASWMLAGTLLIMFDPFSGSADGALEAIFVTPVPLNEIVLALWLIRKGFLHDITARAVRWGSTKQRQQADSIEPAEANEPIEKTDSADPTEPMESTDTPNRH